MSSVQVILAAQKVGGFFMSASYRNYLLIPCLITAVIWQIGCKAPPSDIVNDEASVAGPFYPYPQYLEQELAYLDSMPLAVTYTRYIDGKLKDSLFVEKSVLANRVKEWIVEDPNKTDAKPNYTESSFEDLTINTLTFSITQKGEKYPLRQADVLLHPENKNVRNVMLLRQWEVADSAVTQRIFWVHHQKCQVSATVQPKSGSAYQLLEVYQWDVSF